MPCDSVRTVSIDMGKIDRGRLAAVLAADGWGVQHVAGSATLTATRGVVTFSLSASGRADVRGLDAREAEQLRGEVKRMVSASVVREMGKRFGWKVQSEKAEGDRIKMKLGR